jgi:hypothetical protein
MIFDTTPLSLFYRKLTLREAISHIRSKQELPTSYTRHPDDFAEWDRPVDGLITSVS